MDQINWATIPEGATIYIDGGECGSSMTYNTTLTVQQSGVTIKVADEYGHCGQVNHNGQDGDTSKLLGQCGITGWVAPPSQKSTGIQINTGVNDVTIDGKQWLGWKLHGFARGIDIRDADRVLIQYMEIHNNGVLNATSGYQSQGVPISVNTGAYATSGEGVRFAGDDITLNRNVIHDNGSDAAASSFLAVGNKHSRFRINESWHMNLREWDPALAPAVPGGPIFGVEESFNFCSHTDGLQFYQGDWITVDIAYSWMGPGLTNCLGPLGDANTVVDQVRLNESVLYKCADNGILDNSNSPIGDDWDIDKSSLIMPELQPGKQLIWTRGASNDIESSVLVGGGYLGGPDSFITYEGPGQPAFDDGLNCEIGNQFVDGAPNANPGFTISGAGVDPLVAVTTDMFSIENIQPGTAGCIGSTRYHPDIVMAGGDDSVDYVGTGSNGELLLDRSGAGICEDQLPLCADDEPTPTPTTTDTPTATDTPDVPTPVCCTATPEPDPDTPEPDTPTPEPEPDTPTPLVDVSTDTPEPDPATPTPNIVGEEATPAGIELCGWRKCPGN